MNDTQKRLKDMASVSIPNFEDLSEQLIDKIVEEISGLPMFNQLSETEVEEVLASIKADYSITLDKGVLIEEKGHQHWFLARKASLDMKYWERYRKYLLSDKGFSTSVVNKMDDILDTLTDRLGDPTRDLAFNRRGLVIGDVQSGKTANYTGLICKAVDSGYKVVVLLTGTIEKLRQQTQQRIDEGFVGCNSDAMMKQKDEGLHIGVGKFDPSTRPMVLTSTADDFKQKNASNLNFDLRNINGPVIFVIKKNGAVLKRLNKWLKTFNQNGSNAIDHSLLVIDDEADNASVNTKTNPDDSPTVINGQIRELLHLFTKSSYVGFTATPFANIFIDPDNFDAMVAEDLFPKNYIYCLNSPSNYIGARNIFSDNGDASYMLVRIREDRNDPKSIACILPLAHKSTIQISQIPEDLKEALCSFLLANTIEDIRGRNTSHRSMLVNVSRFTGVQEQMAILLKDYLKTLQEACKNFCLLDSEEALKDPSILYLFNVYKAIYSDIDIKWEIVQRNLHSSCAGIVVQQFNQKAGQDVSYDDYPEGFRVVAVGGMSLSRGLTLEGLVTSYFYRNSKMYDTLMQMGRWFGYRGKYADLCRIWMSEESISWYNHINDATEELRDDIKKYQDTDLTPMDFGLRVRSDLTSLIITARNKMRSAQSRTCAISLSGECIETPEIYSAEEKNTHNLRCVQQLVTTLAQDNTEILVTQRKDYNKYGFHNVPKDVIVDFLKQIDVSPKNEQFNTGTITKFINEYAGHELNSWDIAFATGESEKIIDLGYGIRYRQPEISFSIVNDGRILKMSGSKRRLGRSSDGTFGLSKNECEKVKNRVLKEGKANPAQRDYFNGIKRRPLLTIYIERLKGLANSNLTGAEWESASQEAKQYIGREIVGFGLGFPSLANQETKYARFFLNKIAVQNIFDGDIDEWDDEEDD